MRYLVIILCFFSLKVFGNMVEIIKSAEQKKLWERPQWQTLLHYKNGKSTIDSKTFFYAENGKKNPKEELVATIKAFFQPAQKEYIERINIKKNITQDFQHQHPQCAFPARFSWLSKHLNFSKIPKQKCPAYKKWEKKIQPHQATLVFASAYLNQPSSLFGHTFLRFDKKNKNEKLLSYISNFGAITPPNPNGFSYAYNGLTGGYPGVFSFQPYYEKVKTYGAIENRDLWEYNLDFSKQELKILVDHVWELGYQFVDYFFFTDNCSYLLMEVLDVARLSMRLAEKFPRQTIPLDTVREVLKQKGLMKKVDFRASKETKILSHWGDLTTKEKQAVKSFFRNEKLDENLTENETAKVTEIAYDINQYNLAKGKISLKKMRSRSMALLVARNKISQKENLFSKIKIPIRPDKAHASSRLSLSTGIRDANEFFSLSFRPAYHTIDDLDDGHVFGAGLNFFYGELQYDLENSSLYLNQFDLVSITSFAPWQAIFRPTSWKLGGNLTPRPNDWKRQMGNVFGAVGISAKITKKFLIYSLAEGQISYADKTFSKDILIGTGGSIGFVWNFLHDWKILAESKKIYFSAKKNNDFLDTKISLIFSPKTNFAYQLDYRNFSTNLQSFDEIKLRIKLFFGL